jgi:hypothetical protein
MKVLFICKKRIDSYGKSYGLINSATFVTNMLNDKGIDAKMVSVTDNNDINKEVSLYNPTHVIIEAIWVVPNKFHILMNLHPNITWIVRIHSKIPFLANEGNAFEWIGQYIKLSQHHPKFKLSFNSEQTLKEINSIYNTNNLYLPNIYCPKEYHHEKSDKCKNHIDIGCFGAIRPLKNQLIQAVAAIEFGNKIEKNIRFHINATREEQNGDNVTKNIRALFKDFPQHKLVEHGWMSHDEFIRIVRNMDIGLQVSFSESFNIVAADFVWNDIPIIASKEINFISSLYQADCDSVTDIKNKLNFAYKTRNLYLQNLNKHNLNHYNREATENWIKALKINHCP